jgi:hypothetical protein
MGKITNLFLFSINNGSSASFKIIGLSHNFILSTQRPPEAAVVIKTSFLGLKLLLFILIHFSTKDT